MIWNQPINAALSVPGDKSISHRALIFSVLARGTVRIRGLSPAEDCRSSMNCLRKLGLKITTIPVSADGPEEVIVESPGFDRLLAPSEVLFCGNSGTTMRVLAGLVAGRPFTTRFDGDESLRNRPMSRVLSPLYQMGARVHYEMSHDMAPVSNTAPFAVTGGQLTGKEFALKMASAQVQTAILLAGLQAEGATSVSVPSTVRDHTERMFAYIKVPLTRGNGGAVEVKRLAEPVEPFDVAVPGDISSAAFFMVAAACLPGSDLLLKNVGINPGRRLVVDALKQMGADLTLIAEKTESGEPVADIRVRYAGRLQGATISGEKVAAGIDEVPILALAGSTCEGKFIVEGAGELRHKESDRLTAMVENLRSLGVSVETAEDGFALEGIRQLPGASYWRTYNDHRLAMTGLIANLIARQPLKVEECESIKISYPQFVDDLAMLTAAP